MLLAWLSMAGLLNFYGFLTDNKMGLSKFEGWGAFAYGVTALISSIGVFRFKKWAFHASVVWVAVILIRDLLEFLYEPRSDISSSAILHNVLTYSILGALLFYIQKKIPTGVNITA